MAFYPAVHLSNIDWDNEPAFTMDLDCDGKEDKIYLGYIEEDFVVKAIVSSQEQPDQLQFGLSQPSRQDALCGAKIELSAFESNPEMLQEIFGEVPEGYHSSGQCLELNVSDGECDSIHIFWNHKENKMNWWRL